MDLDETFLSALSIDCGEDVNDSIFKPDEVAISESECEIADEDAEYPVTSMERCLLVYETQLKCLLRHCPNCGTKVDSTATREIKSNGSLYAIQITCLKGCSMKWTSQPDIKSCSGIGNLDLTSAITLAGIPQCKFEKFAWLMNLKFIHNTTFYRIRKEFIQPTISEFWAAERENVIAELMQSGCVTLIGDGRSDSPGHSAKYGTYTFMSADSGKIVDTAVITVTEVRSHLPS